MTDGVTDISNPARVFELRLGVHRFIHGRQRRIGVFAIRLTEGLMALDMRCTHMGCVMPFAASATRFHCPCHGSQYTPSGVYIAGPSPRDMGRYRWQVVGAQNKVLAESVQGEPLPVPAGTQYIRIWTDPLIFGKPSGV